MDCGRDPEHPQVHTTSFKHNFSMLFLFRSYNVSLLEEWLRSRGLHTGGAAATLKSLIQAAQLLQMSKRSEADGQAIAHTCNALSSQQVGHLDQIQFCCNDGKDR